MKETKKLTKMITLGVDPYTGKRIRKRISATSATGLQIAEQNARLELAECDNPSNAKFGPYSEKWLKAYKSSREAATQEMYEVALHKTKGISQKRLRDIRQMDLQLLINKHAEHPSSCKQLKLTLDQVFKRAIHDGIIKRNPAADLELPVQPETEERALTEEEKKAIRNITLDPVEQIYIKLLYYCGLRPQEACALMPQDVSYKTNEIVIRRAVGYEKDTPYIKQTKTRKIRRVPISASFASELKQYASALKSQNSLYYVHHEGELLTKKQRSNLWIAIRDKINVALGGNKNLDLTNGLRAYTFRHNYCCECYYRGISVKMTAELMGNSPQMVMKVYAHLDHSKEPLEELRKLSM